MDKRIAFSELLKSSQKIRSGHAGHAIVEQNQIRTALSFPAESFRGIIALYSVIHVPLQEQPALITSMYHWLQADGYILIIVGAEEWTGTEDNWLVPGTTMYWSHADANTYSKWFSSAGFTIVDTKFVPEEAAGHTLLIARKDG